MKKTIFYILIFSGFMASAPELYSRTSASFGIQIGSPYYYDGYYDNYPNWNGPGFYFGVYFNNEYQYRNWRHHHPRRYHHNGYNHNRYHHHH